MINKSVSFVGTVGSGSPFLHHTAMSCAWLAFRIRNKYNAHKDMREEDRDEKRYLWLYARRNPH